MIPSDANANLMWLCSEQADVGASCLLHSELPDDPIAKRPLPCSSDVSSISSPVISNQSEQSTLQENQHDQLAILELEKKLGVLVCSSEAHVNVVDEVHDKELLMLSAKLAGEVLPTSGKAVSIQVLREHWKSCAPSSVQLCELGVLLRDYQRFIMNRHRETLMHNSFADVSNQELETYQFFHLKTASQLRMSDIPKLLDEYKQLLSH